MFIILHLGKLRFWTVSPEGRQCLVHSGMADAQASHTRCSITIKWTRYGFPFIPLGLTLFCFCIFISNISERWSYYQRLSATLPFLITWLYLLPLQCPEFPPLCQLLLQGGYAQPQVKRHFAVSESIQLPISSMKMIYKSLQPWLLSWKLILYFQLPLSLFHADSIFFKTPNLPHFLHGFSISVHGTPIFEIFVEAVLLSSKISGFLSLSGKSSIPLTGTHG